MVRRTNKYESDIQGKIIRSVVDWGWKCIKHSPGFGSCPKGWPDITVYLPNGKVVLLEIKRPDGVVEPLQQHTITELRRLEHMVFVVDNHGHAVRVLRSIHERSNRPGRTEEAAQGAGSNGADDGSESRLNPRW